MEFNIPVSAQKANRLIHILDLAEGSRVFDAGCGEGEFLVCVMEMTGAAGLGVDIDAASIATARSKAETRVPPGGWEFREWDLQKEVIEDGAFDAAICLGSTHAFGSGEAAYPNTIARLSRAARPGGQILIGEGYWKTTPAPEYLDLIGEPVGIYRDHATNIGLAEAQGLVPLYAAVSNDDEWDDFEWTHRMRIERESMLRPDDAGVAEKLQRSRAWRDGYLRWGRSTMGFGFYLFMKPR